MVNRLAAAARTLIPETVQDAQNGFTRTVSGINVLAAAARTLIPETVLVKPFCASWTVSGINVLAAAASRFTIGGFPSSTTAGTAGSLIVTAYDAYNNVAAGYA